MVFQKTKEGGMAPDTGKWHQDIHNNSAMKKGEGMEESDEGLQLPDG